MTSTKLVKLYILYYFSLTMIVLPGNVLYILLLFPLPIFVFFNVNIYGGKIKKVTILLGVHFLIVISIAFVRMDIDTVLNVSQISLIMFILFNSNVNITYRFINKIFLLGIALSVFGFVYGSNAYGFIPHYIGSAEQNWRISLFLRQSVHASGIFSLQLIIINYFSNKAKSKWFYILLGLYFLIFSGSRVSIIAFCFSTFALILMNFINIKKKILWYVYPITAIVAIVVFVYIFEFMHFKFSFGSQFLDNITKVDSPAGVSSYRFWLWQKHLEIFSNNSLLGIGDFYLRDMYDYVPGYSESGFTNILVRDGLVSIIYFLFLFSFFVYASKYKNEYLYVFSLAIFILIFGIGAITISYSFTSFLILGNWSSIYNQARTNYWRCQNLIRNPAFKVNDSY